MTQITRSRRPLFRFAAPVLGALACVTLLGAAATPAAARGWDHDHARARQWHEHERHDAWRWRHDHPYYYSYAPRYYAPAPVYSPAPVYGAPSLNFVIPLHIR